MKLECIASVLNLRKEPKGDVFAELRSGDLIEVTNASSNREWVNGTVLSGISAGKSGFVKRKWIIQSFNKQPVFPTGNRVVAAKIIADRTQEFDPYREYRTP
ncbi:hypothetical protein [Cellvibrio sp. OA-2007]|uniref:hypothetical protein n=1 Tax=Cellvibrio sp. OA-2007 TaxID=529823 RepID=UPI000784D0A7|nr:hypothetical protein [Cellvibrio sp. OA-2007]